MNAPHCAALLLDLQRDFLAPEGRMPVGAAEAARVLAAAQAVLSGESLAGALPVAVVTEFPQSAWLPNVFRRHAAVAGSPGAALDPRLQLPPAVKVFVKHSSSAFESEALIAHLKENQVSRLFVMGVFAEGCVRATALAAVKLGYDVSVPAEAIGTNSGMKRRFALWAMSTGGVKLIHALPKHAA